MFRPTLPGFSVAPMTATDLGEKIGSSGRRRAWCRMSWTASMPGCEEEIVVILVAVNDSIHTKKLAVKNIPHSTKIGECEPTIDARRIWALPKTTFRSWVDRGSSGFSGWLQQAMHGAEEIFDREGFA